MRLIDARISTAPSAATGTQASVPVRNSSTIAIAAAATSPVTCVRPPELSAIAVRESAPLTAKPCETAAATLAAPSAANSRSTSIS